MRHIFLIFICCIMLGHITGADKSSSGNTSSSDEKPKTINLVDSFIKTRKKMDKKGLANIKARSGTGLDNTQGLPRAGTNNIYDKIQKQRGLQHSSGSTAHAPTSPYSGASSSPASGRSPSAFDFGSQYSHNSPPSTLYRPSTSTYNIGSSFGFGQKKNSIANPQKVCNVGGRQILVGDTWSITGICAVFTCNENHFRTVTSHCPPLKFQEKYKCEVLMQDMNQDYPYCCPKLSCSTAQSKTNTNSQNQKEDGGYTKTESLFGRSPSSYSF